MARPRLIRRLIPLALLAAATLALKACERGAEHAQVRAWSADGRLGGLRVTERAPTAAPPGAERTLTVAATGDLKGWITTATLYPRRRRHTGLAHLAPVLRDLRAGDPGLVLLDAGDALHGAPSATLAVEGSGLPALDFPVLTLMNALRYDAMALGNFDFALGGASLAHAEADADFRWLSANLERVEDGAAAGTWLAPYVVLERGGVRVGVLGLTTPAAALGRVPRELDGKRFAALEATARRWVPVLRDLERVDVLVGLFHSGLEGGYARDDALRGGVPLIAAAGRVAEAVPGFDLIFSGDAHQLLPRESTDGHTPWGVPVLQPGAYGEAVAVARLHLAERDGRWRVTGVTRHTLRAAAEPDAAALARVEEPLAHTRARLAEATRVRFRRVPYKTEFYRCAGALSHATAAFLAGETADEALSLLPMRWRWEPPVESELGEPVRRAHLYRWMRYGERLVQASLTGRQMTRLLEGYVRHVRGWRVHPLEVLWPGGLDVGLPEEGSEIAGLRRAADGAAVPLHAAQPVWLTSFLWHGGLALAPEALLPGGPPARALAPTLRAGLFALLSDPTFAIPPQCARWLAH